MRHLLPRGPRRSLRDRMVGRVPVEMDIASEFRYRNPVLGEGDLVIGISQSGETADTLAAMRLARERGATGARDHHIMGSQATRDSDGVIFYARGLEIGVAATKTFVAQVAVMYLRAAPRADTRDARSRGGARLPRAAPASAQDHGAGRERGRPDPRDRRALEGRRLLPLPGSARAVDLPRGRAQAQGDLLHPDRRVRRGRDEARADRPSRRGHAGGVRGHRLAGLDKVLSNMAEVRARGRM